MLRFNQTKARARSVGSLAARLAGLVSFFYSTKMSLIFSYTVVWCESKGEIQMKELIEIILAHPEICRDLIIAAQALEEHPHFQAEVAE